MELMLGTYLQPKLAIIISFIRISNLRNNKDKNFIGFSKIIPGFGII
jgi:hypothetical protein